MSAAGVGRVFISYRRQESSGLAGRMYDRLRALADAPGEIGVEFGLELKAEAGALSRRQKHRQLQGDADLTARSSCPTAPSDLGGPWWRAS